MNTYEPILAGHAPQSPIWRIEFVFLSYKLFKHWDQKLFKHWDQRIPSWPGRFFPHCSMNVHASSLHSCKHLTYRTHLLLLEIARTLRSMNTFQNLSLLDLQWLMHTFTPHGSDPDCAAPALFNQDPNHFNMVEPGSLVYWKTTANIRKCLKKSCSQFLTTIRLLFISIVTRWWWINWNRFTIPSDFCWNSF